MQEQQKQQQAQAQLNQEASQAMQYLAQQGIPENIAKAAIRGGMGYIRDDDRLQVIDAAALWLQQHRDLLFWPQQQAAHSRQPMVAPPVPAPAPAGAPSAPVRPGRDASWQAKVAHLEGLLGR
jgi:hypothetical protein